MRFAIIGCGYVADFYADTLPNHPQLQLTGVFDRNPERNRLFAEFHKFRAYSSLQEVLDDGSVELVLNLTNPRSHFEVSMAALQAGKHVYSEKPLAMSLDHCQALVDFAASKKLLLVSAPCNVLGENAQTIWKALREQQIGVPRLVYAEIDDGPVPLLDYKKWISKSGAPWPYKDEFEVGCTPEHAAYYLGMLTAFFGPAKRITSFSTAVMEDKLVPLDMITADYAVGCIEFRSGVVARLTCSLYAPHDHRLRIFGDKGVISTDEVWHYGATVHIAKRTPLRLKFEKYPTLARLVGLGQRSLRPVRPARFKASGGPHKMDFCRGIAEMADSITENRPCRLSAAWSLHVNELVLAMQNPCEYGSVREITSTFEPFAPMPWAR
jgi:predicted dehydrogenase